ncbi:hypothetical protein CMI37_04430 [Candidatus Pacearchaeota archaeon]|nr:hypothetical protein [Candidatus Pacearchaeota archaeon]|tara:strand:+ start:1602 stop:1853 length:252 start_codon:yes stop_codon:yes gene_type:complete
MKKDKREVPTICKSCGLKPKDNVHAGFFSWQNLNGKVVGMCWNCADALHAETLEIEWMYGIREGEKRADGKWLLENIRKRNKK